LIGHGGMGVVLKAREPSLDRFVAIKVLAPHLASSKSARKRFAREARAAAAVLHENVIPIYQVAEWEGLPYFVMPYWPAPSLGQRLEDDGPMSLQATLVIGMQIARGLEAAHSQGLVHRDVKPANVLLNKGTDRAVITDFGLARAADDASLTQAGTLAGTPHYMSPEQARGETVDPKSDLFSLGSVIFAMLKGSPPISEESGTATMKRIRSGKLPKLVSNDNCPDWMTRLIAWLHHDDPAKRPKSAGQVADLLEQCLAHLRMPEKAQIPELLRGSPSSESNRGIWIAAALILLACSMVVGYSFLPTNPAPGNPKKAPTSNSLGQNSVPADLDNFQFNQAQSTEDSKGQSAVGVAPGSPPVGLDWHLTELQLRALEGDIENLERQLNTFETEETTDQTGDRP
jgi:serine/threonine protein kinase